MSHHVRLKAVVSIRGIADRTLILFTLCGSAFASEGRIPISQPVTITQPGSYVVTSDIVTSDTAITIAASPVSLDLNGHAISNPTTPDPNDFLIDVLPSAPDVRIENGHLIGGAIGINSDANTIASIRIERMHLRGQQSFGIHSRARTFVIKDCTLQGSGNETGIWLWGVDPLLGGGRIESNRIAGYRDNIYIEYSVGMVIKDNVIDSNYRGLVFTVSYYLPGGLVYGNTVHGGAEGGLWIGSAHSRVRDNTITGAGPGIGSLLGAHGNIITDNVLRDCLGSGIIAGSGMTFVDGNLSESNVPYDSWSPGCGIHLTDHNHVYRNNMLRNNPGGGVCHVGSSTDAGGNIQ